MHHRHPHKRHAGFTLVEMLIVLAIIALLAGLLAFTLPGFIDRSRNARGASALQGWLNYARQRAQYEQTPRGIRFYVEASVDYPIELPLVVYKCQYLEKPDDWVGGRLENGDASNPNNTESIKVVGANFNDGAVGIGDYLEINSTGQVHYILNIVPSDPTNAPTILDKLQLWPTGLPQPITEPITNYRIQRRARVSGDEPLQLPNRVVIDVSTAKKYADPPYFAGNFLPNVVTAGGENYFDIMFAPSGAVLDYNRNKIILWVRGDDKDTEFQNNPTLLVVYANSGAVAAFEPVVPAAPTNSPYVKVK